MGFNHRLVGGRRAACAETCDARDGGGKKERDNVDCVLGGGPGG